MEQYVIKELGGDLQERISLCRSRMSETDYSSEFVFKPLSYDWPGDWEGRTLLAMECLKNYYGNEIQNFTGCLRELEKHLNKEGYFGNIVDAENVNEQQLAGNSWFLRFLCERYDHAKDEEILKKIQDVVYNFYLKIECSIKNYPVNVDGSDGSNYAAGRIFEKVDEWNLSSDSGCIYISLDGLSHAHSILKDERLGSLIKWMCMAFISTNFSKKNFQSHAFLSGLRGMVRYYVVSGDTEVYQGAKKMFDYYLDTSLNFVYESYGVVNKPLGSEGCAVVDQAMLCAQFYKLTGDVKYLELYRKMYVNAIRTTQRSNGGMGCNVAVGDGKQDFARSVPEFAEATWCCTMRGCEGITDFTKNIYHVEGNEITPMLLNDSICEFYGGKVIIKLKTDYPKSGKTVFEVLKCDIPFKLKMWISNGYTTDWGCGKFERFIDHPCLVSLEHNCVVKEREAHGKMGYEYGDMVLGEAIDNSKKCIEHCGRRLQPLISFSKVSMDDVLKVSQRLLF